MNLPDPPLNPELLDELLSADLDGEFDRAAADLGFDVPAARAAVAATPGAAARRSALVRARALLATPPALGAERADAFVTAAVAAADARVTPVPLRARRSTRVWQAVAGVAAAAAVVVGVVAVAGTNTGNESKSSSADSPAAESAATTTPAARAPRTSVAFGDVSQPGSIESRARVLLPPTEGNAALVPQASSADGANLALGGSKRTGYAADSVARKAARRGITGCVTALRQSVHLGSAPVLSGTGTSAGKPVYVAVFDEPTGRVAYVLSAADCSVVTRVALP